MPQDDAAFASFERKWLQANPEQATVAVFLAPALRRRAAAFGSLVHELEQAAFDVREPQVAAVKLNWWHQEMVGAANGSSRHPIVQALFEDEQTRAVDAALWSNLIDGAIAQLDTGATSALDDSIAALAAFYRPVASLEAAVAGGDEAHAAANARVWIGSRLLHSVAAHPDHERTIPLALLARHGLARSELAEPGPRRAALLRDYLGLVQAQIDDALARAPHASLGRRVRARLDSERAAKARAAEDPMLALGAGSEQRRWRSLWLSWREARQLARNAV